MGVDQDVDVIDAQRSVERVYRAESLKMWRALVGYTGDRDAADDAVAEAFARALEHGHNVNDLSAWTWRVAFRVAAADARSRLGSAQVDGVVVGPTADVPELVRALRELPPKQRLAIVLRDYADRPIGEVAAILGCSQATVHVHVSAGRRRLRPLLEVHDA
jgi:DNA-directed RNA polymerase specialized sigma24 family protein